MVLKGKSEGGRLSIEMGFRQRNSIPGIHGGRSFHWDGRSDYLGCSSIGIIFYLEPFMALEIGVSS
jgi:hypothetical protein